MLKLPETEGRYSHKHVPSPLSVSRALTSAEPRTATKNGVPPLFILIPSSSKASMVKDAVCRAIAVWMPIPEQTVFAAEAGPSEKTGCGSGSGSGSVTFIAFTTLPALLTFSAALLRLELDPLRESRGMWVGLCALPLRALC